MEWLMVAGAVLGAWAVLSVLSGERERRVRAIDLAAETRRQAARRAAVEAAAPPTVGSPGPAAPPTAN